MKVCERRAPTKKKSIAFKATPAIMEDEDTTNKGEKDFAMLIQKVRKMFYNKGWQSNFRRARPHERTERRKEKMGPCYHCKKIGHFLADFPSLQATTSKILHKKKAMVATWDDLEIDFEEKNDIANVCFMKTEMKQPR